MLELPYLRTEIIHILVTEKEANLVKIITRQELEKEAFRFFMQGPLEEGATAGHRHQEGGQPERVGHRGAPRQV